MHKQMANYRGNKMKDRNEMHNRNIANVKRSKRWKQTEPNK